MRGKIFIITTVITCIILIGGGISATGQSHDYEKLRKYYQDYISKCISKNKAKAGLEASKSANLRSCGILSKQKVVFLTNNQNTLVEEMIKKKIGTKPYKVEYYLNKRFHEKYQ